ncbi:MAG: hypothetical protein M1822_006537 [Bathelium mastoideum]|nr:MAG: hypothetical protein M1822_006537 [Bathelium mastoideum]
MAVPRKYRNIGDFHRYYSGEKQAPVLTLVIGGNHEASNYFSELYYGGWLAPNIYYLGAANVLRYGPFRIAGLSGIFKAVDYYKPHHERLPYDRDELRSVFHVRECDVSRLLQFGDYEKLFADRPSFFESAKIDNLDSAPAEQVMNLLRPDFWFSGHMHIKYTAEVDYEDNENEYKFKHLAVTDELASQLPASMFKAASGKKKRAPMPSPPNITNTGTNFLALDKPGPKREFLELLDLISCCSIGVASTKPYMQKTADGKFALHYDEEWLSILRSSSDGLVAEDAPFDIAAKKSDAAGTDTVLHNLHWIQNNVTAKGLLKIPDNFERHAPTYNRDDKVNADEQPCEFPNSQTEAFCQMLQMRNKFSADDDVVEGDDDVVFG